MSIQQEYFRSVMFIWRKNIHGYDFVVENGSTFKFIVFLKNVLNWAIAQILYGIPDFS